MANAKYREILENPYTGEIKEITASKEDILERRILEQNQQWEKEKYIRDRKTEASDLNSWLNQNNTYLQELCYCGIQPLLPEQYIRENVSKIYKPRRHRPNRKEIEKEFGLRGISKAWGKVLRTKSYQANQESIEAEYQKRITEYESQTKLDDEERLEKQKKVEKEYRERVERYSKGHSKEICNYAEYALNKDDFSINGKDTYSCDIKTTFFRYGSVLRLKYRLPNEDEMLTVAKYIYNEKKDAIEAIKYSDKETRQKRLCIAESLLLRAVAIIFRSDYFKKIKSIMIVGYLRYFDSAYGKDQTKNVIACMITRDLFDQLSIERVNPVDLFSRVLHASIANGLYSKDPYSINEVDLSKWFNSDSHDVTKKKSDKDTNEEE